MADPTTFDPPGGELAAILETPSPERGVRSFEFSCRGDRVPLSLRAPESGVPRAVLLVQPAPTDADVQTWFAAGVALASIELPLFGTRHSPKLSDKLADGTSQILRTEFTRQGVMELRRAIDVLEELGLRKADDPVAFAGAGVAASLGAIACATDERFRGAVLASDTDFGGSSEYVTAIAPRPLLELKRDEPDLLGACWEFLSPILV